MSTEQAIAELRRIDDNHDYREWQTSATVAAACAMPIRRRPGRARRDVRLGSRGRFPVACARLTLT